MEEITKLLEEARALRERLLKRLERIELALSLIDDKKEKTG